MIIPNELYPVTICQDRYGGTYTGGEWIAIAGGHVDEVMEVAHGDDVEASLFGKFATEKFVAVGDTPDQALENLMKKQEAE